MCLGRRHLPALTGQAGERWEVHTVLADLATFGQGPPTLIDVGQAPEGGACCGIASGTDTAADTSASCC
ncbi:MAG: hypothetical protein NVS3B1_16180 [Marmoricola sp.]